jgi:hypothetical protein
MEEHVSPNFDFIGDLLCQMKVLRQEERQSLFLQML